MGMINRVLANPGAYIRQLKFLTAGLYFDFILKEYRTNGCSFTVPRKHVNRVGRGYFALGLYEKDERAFIGSFLTGNETVLELGGCIGVISCIANRLLENPVHHVVIEANPQMIPYLEENKIKNGCGFQIVNAVVANSKEVDFFLGDSFVASGIYQNDANLKKVTVQGIKPQELEQRYGLRFDTIVMDIEGGEFNLIIENKDFLSGINKIFMEEHKFILGDEKYKEYESVLKALNFQKKLFQENISCWQKTH